MQTPPPPPQPSPTITTTATTTTITTLLLLLLLILHRSPTTSPPTSSKLFHSPFLLNPNPNQTLPSPPTFAYLISTSSSSSDLLRLLFSVYHPTNLYLLHLDKSSPQIERERLAIRVREDEVLGRKGNVFVIGNAGWVYKKGSSGIAEVLRGMAVLVKVGRDWDWFVNLRVGDYPLVTQDDLLHVFSFLPKDLNFVNHTSYIGWRESRRLKPIIVDPGLYLSAKTGMFYASQKRDLPDAFQLFTGSSTAILSRKFVEFCLLGTDNLPRLLLMYYANTPSSLLNYFPTVLCNSPEFNTTTINHNLLYASLNKASKEDPRPLDTNDLESLISSGSAFGTKFHPDDPVLDRIDREVLGRMPGKVVPGGWCLGEGNDSCATWGDADILRPGPGAKRLAKLLVELLSNGTYRSQQCVVES